MAISGKLNNLRIKPLLSFICKCNADIATWQVVSALFKMCSTINYKKR